MYSGTMTVVIRSVYGTGFAGSLTYSSNDGAGCPGGSGASRTAARKCNANGFVPGGGQAACSRQRFVPVSNTSAFGRFNSPFPLRWKLKNGSSTFSRKNSAVFEPKATGPSAAPVPQFQPP